MSACRTTVAQHRCPAALLTKFFRPTDAIDMAKRRRREYLQLLDAAKRAAETAIDAYNSVWHKYRDQTTLLLLANAWELLAKAILVQQRESIARGQRGETISGEEAVHRLQLKKLIEQNQAETIQQVISLRHAACHHLLPDVPVEVMQHLLFYSTKFFREAVATHFKGHADDMSDNYLSLSFSDLTTYADRVQRSVSRVKKSGNDKRLVWLLERGIQFDGESYITEGQFAEKYRGRKKILPHLGLSRFVKKSDMVRIVPIQAPRNYTADITLRKGNKADASLPVILKKTEVEADYPFLTKEVAQKIGKTQNWTARAVAILGLKGDPKFHQAVRASANSLVHRYSQATVEALQQKLAVEPAFDPYHVQAVI